MIANSKMVASQGGMTSGVCTPSMNQNVESSYSLRSSLKTVEYAYRSCHPSAPGGVGIANWLGKRSAIVFLLKFSPGGRHGRRVMVLIQPPAGLAMRRMAAAGCRVQHGLDHAGDRVRGAGRGL